MGIDCHAILEIGPRPPTRCEVLKRLDRLNPLIAEWWPPAMPGRLPRYRPDIDAAWRVDESLSDALQTWLTGSRGLLVQWCRRAAIHHAEPRWRTFLGVAEHRVFVRRVSRAVARVLSGRRVLYVPDGGLPASRVIDEVAAGCSASDAEVWLRANCGPPRFADSVTAPLLPADEPLYLVDDLDTFDPDLDVQIER